MKYSQYMYHILQHEPWCNYNLAYTAYSIFRQGGERWMQISIFRHQAKRLWHLSPVISFLQIISQFFDVFTIIPEVPTVQLKFAPKKRYHWFPASSRAEILLHMAKNGRSTLLLPKNIFETYTFVITFIDYSAPSGYPVQIQDCSSAIWTWSEDVIEIWHNWALDVGNAVYGRERWSSMLCSALPRSQPRCPLFNYSNILITYWLQNSSSMSRLYSQSPTIVCF